MWSPVRHQQHLRLHGPLLAHPPPRAAPRRRRASHRRVVPPQPPRHQLLLAVGAVELTALILLEMHSLSNMYYLDHRHIQIPITSDKSR